MCTCRGVGIWTLEDALAADIDRRETLAAILATIMVPLTGAAGLTADSASAADLPLQPRQFLELSARLCDMPVRGTALADSIQGALIERHAADRLIELAKLVQNSAATDVERWQSDPKTKELAKDIISVWYSGLTGQGDKQRVVTHESALAWRATSYAKPPGTCGEFGDWTARPAGSAVLEGRP